MNVKTKENSEFIEKKEIDIAGIKVLIKLYKVKNKNYKTGYSYKGYCYCLDEIRKLVNRHKEKIKHQIERLQERLKKMNLREKDITEG